MASEAQENCPSCRTNAIEEEVLDWGSGNGSCLECSCRNCRNVLDASEQEGGLCPHCLQIEEVRLAHDYAGGLCSICHKESAVKMIIEFDECHVFCRGCHERLRSLGHRSEFSE